MENNSLKKEYEKSVIHFIITIWFGYLGIHKFLNKDYKMGIVYLLTLGLFGIGWIIDTFKAIKRLLDNYKKLNNGVADIKPNINHSDNIKTNNTPEEKKAIDKINNSKEEKDIYDKGTKYFFESVNDKIWFFDNYLEHYSKTWDRTTKVDYDVEKMDLYFHLKSISLSDDFLFISYYPMTFDKSQTEVIQLIIEKNKIKKAQEICETLQNKILRKQDYDNQDKKNIKATKKNNWNEKRDEISNGINPCPLWNNGTDAQQEFADDLVEKLSKRVAKYFCWAIKDKLVDELDIDNIVNSLYYAINEIDDANWWCNKKNSDDKKIVLLLLEDEDEKELVKNIYKHYDN